MLVQGTETSEADGVPVNPVLPDDFDDTPNYARPKSHFEWWHRPFIVTYHDDSAKWLEAWPSGVRYDVRCLDGGAWDRSTWWGSFATIDEAVQLANTQDPDRFGTIGESDWLAARAEEG